MEQHSFEIVCWRVSCRALVVELFCYLLAFTSMFFYFRIAPVLALSGIFVVVCCAVLAVWRFKEIIGVVCTLNYCTNHACFTTFVSDNSDGSLAIKHVSMLWRSSFGALIRIECSENTKPVWKQWIYAGETSPDDYRRLLRVLR